MLHMKCSMKNIHLFTEYAFSLIKLFQAFVLSEAVAQRRSVKKVFLEISQNSQENTCVRVSFLIKLQAWGLNFAKFLRAPFFAEHYGGGFCLVKNFQFPPTELKDFLALERVFYCVLFKFLVKIAVHKQESTFC